MVIMKASTKLETPSLLISSRSHVRGLHSHAEDILTLENQNSVIFTSLGMSYVQVRERGMMMDFCRNPEYRFELITVILDFYILRPANLSTYFSLNLSQQIIICFICNMLLYINIKLKELKEQLKRVEKTKRG